MVVVAWACGRGVHFDAFASLAEAQEFINELFVKGVDFEVKFR